MIQFARTHEKCIVFVNRELLAENTNMHHA